MRKFTVSSVWESIPQEKFCSLPANSQCEAFHFFKAIILSMFLCIFLKREANMTQCTLYSLYSLYSLYPLYSLYSFYSMSWAYFHHSIWIQWKPSHKPPSRSIQVKRGKHIQTSSHQIKYLVKTILPVFFKVKKTTIHSKFTNL